MKSAIRFKETVLPAMLLLGMLSWIGCGGGRYEPPVSPSPTPTKKINITNPTLGQQIQVQQAKDTKACYFPTSGTSEGIHLDRKLQIHVLVHPTNPFASDWYIQPLPTIQENGEWSGQSWIGNKEIAPQVGDEFEIIAIATEDKQLAARGQVNNPRDIAVAQSSVVKVTIGSIKPAR